MTDKHEILQDHLGDMLGVERHILSSIERQTQDDRVKANRDAYELLLRIQSTLSAHTIALERCFETTTEGGTESMLKKAATTTMGMLSGLYSRLRTEEPVSRNLRDDYTALNLAIISYTMLHTTGLALRDSGVAELALRHLSDLTPFVVELSKLIPHVVARELTEEGKSYDATIAHEAMTSTQKAWERHAGGIH